MIDFAKITIKAGDGGNGVGSFMHTKGKRRGKADGGDGGRGGNIYFIATADLTTLEPFRFVKEYKAQNGVNGLSNRRKGADGEDLKIKVPLGTVITISTPYANVIDLSSKDELVLLARGGEGGRGNAHLRDELGRRPFKGENGDLGEEMQVTLELKLIAEVGLIGLPNAGKSTLLAALTSAMPKIANYPFTTLEPNLGVMSTVTSDSKRIVIADIPGLIEGASEGKGLGDLFLRHIERTNILVHLIDASQGDDLWKSYQTIRNELRLYSKELAKKKELIVFNKIDFVSSEELEKKLAVFVSKRKKVFKISALKNQGLESLVGEILKDLKKLDHK